MGTFTVEGVTARRSLCNEWLESSLGSLYSGCGGDAVHKVADKIVLIGAVPGARKHLFMHSTLL